MSRAGRVLSVTVGLVAAGGVCGATAGAVALSIVLALMGEGITLADAGVGALFGAPLGAVTAPLLSWLFLRRVPLGRMFLWCSVGTTIGGTIGGLPGALLGCLMTAIILSAAHASAAQRA